MTPLMHKAGLAESFFHTPTVTKLDCRKAFVGLLETLAGAMAPFWERGLCYSGFWSKATKLVLSASLLRGPGQRCRQCNHQVKIVRMHECKE